MHMFGSNAFSSTTTRPYAGDGRNNVYNQELMSLAAGHVDEATVSEEMDCPPAATARASLAARADPAMRHRMHPNSPVMALSWTQGYGVEVHREKRAAHDDTSPEECAAESISFLCTDPGLHTHFYVAGTVHKLPKTFGAVTRAYILWQKSNYHCALPTIDDAGREVTHGNAGSALVTRCVATNRPR